MTVPLPQDLETLLAPDIQAYIADHENSDVAALALGRHPQGWPMPLVLDQIAARRKARAKLPGWVDVPGMIFPPPQLMEQASSLATARYKASLVEGDVFADLTAGTGADFVALLSRFARGVAVEADPVAAALLRHNLPLLTSRPFEVVNRDARHSLGDLSACDLIYIDPQRRAVGKRGLFRFAECSPDIVDLLPALLDKARAVMIKTSPVLDISQAVAQLGCVADIHVVEWRGDCREVLYVLRRGADAPVVTAVALGDDGVSLRRLSFGMAEEQAATPTFSDPQAYFYEPSPAFMKAGGFSVLSARYGAARLQAHTHLYTSAGIRPDFPGRAFRLEGVYPAGGKGLSMTRANVAVRNFPMPAETLRRKLGIKDGGDDYLFGCTLSDGRKAILHGRKA